MCGHSAVLLLTKHPLRGGARASHTFQMTLSATHHHICTGDIRIPGSGSSIKMGLLATLGNYFLASLWFIRISCWIHSPWDCILPLDDNMGDWNESGGNHA